MGDRKIRTSFAMVPGWVIQRVTDGTAMRVYLHLAWKYANTERQAFPEVATLAGELDLSERTVKRAVSALLDAGAIQVDRVRHSGGHYGRNVYTLPLDDPNSQGSNMAPGSDLQEQPVLPGQHQGADLTPGVDQEEQGVSAVQNQGPNLAPRQGSNLAPLKNNQTQENNQTETSTSATADAPPDHEPRPDIDKLCDTLRASMIDNGCRPPAITKRWRDAARLLLDRDRRPLDEALDILAWSQDDPFWQQNIHSLPTFRKHYDRLRMRWEHTNPSRTLRSGEAIREWLKSMYREGTVKPIEDRSGVRYQAPDLPDGITTTHEAREFHIAARRKWIAEHHQQITDAILRREHPEAS